MITWYVYNFMMYDQKGTIINTNMVQLYTYFKLQMMQYIALNDHLFNQYSYKQYSRIRTK